MLIPNASHDIRDFYSTRYESEFHKKNFKPVKKDPVQTWADFRRKHGGISNILPARNPIGFDTKE